MTAANCKATEAARAAMGTLLAYWKHDEEAQTDCGATLEFALAELSDMTNGDPAEFWERVAKLAKQEATGNTEPVREAGPMSDHKALEFEGQQVPFGKDKGQRVRAVSMEDLRKFYDWFWRQRRFFDTLGEYLESPRAKTRAEG